MAAGITFGTGFLMTPAVGAVFMSASTIIVAINAQLLRFYQEERLSPPSDSRHYDGHAFGAADPPQCLHASRRCAPGGFR